jgi:hypothetical protein
MTDPLAPPAQGREPASAAHGDDSPEPGFAERVLRHLARYERLESEHGPDGRLARRIAPGATVPAPALRIELPGFPGEETPAEPQVDTLDELFALEDRAFIRAAFVAVLGRRPDPQGLEAYLAHRRAGMPRVEILHHLATSPEGRERSPRLEGLGACLRRYRWSRLPVLGAWIGALLSAKEMARAESQRGIREGRLAAQAERRHAQAREAYDAIRAALRVLQRSHDRLALEVWRLERGAAADEGPGSYTVRAGADLEVALRTGIQSRDDGAGSTPP